LSFVIGKDHQAAGCCDAGKTGRNSGGAIGGIISPAVAWNAAFSVPGIPETGLFNPGDGNVIFHARRTPMQT
jgi:hypothetical protein